MTTEWTCHQCGATAYSIPNIIPDGWVFHEATQQRSCPLCVGREEQGDSHRTDKGKAPVGLIAPEMWWALADVLKFGADKYEARGWENNPMPWMRSWASAMRHMLKWEEGEDKDQESGLSHLDHAACNLMFLIAYGRRGIGEDTRPGKGA